MFARMIKTLRKNSALSQAQLARQLGVTRSSVNAWEMGAAVPSVQTLIRLSDFFKVSSDLMLGISRNRSISVEGLGPDEISILLRLISYFRSRHPS